MMTIVKQTSLQPKQTSLEKSSSIPAMKLRKENRFSITRNEILATFTCPATKLPLSASNSTTNKYARQILSEINCIIACGSSGRIGPDGLLYDRKAFYQRRNSSNRCSRELVANGSWEGLTSGKWMGSGMQTPHEFNIYVTRVPFLPSSRIRSTPANLG